MQEGQKVTVLRVQLSNNIRCLDRGLSHGAATAAVLVTPGHTSPTIHCLESPSSLAAASRSNASHHGWSGLLSDGAAEVHVC